MKFRNKFVSKRIGTKTLASLLAFGMALGSPMAVFADDGETAVVAENTVQAKAHSFQRSPADAIWPSPPTSPPISAVNMNGMVSG